MASQSSTAEDALDTRDGYLLNSRESDPDDFIRFPLRDPWYYRIAKRAMDIAFSLTGILLFSPLMIPLATIWWFIIHSL